MSKKQMIRPIRGNLLLEPPIQETISKGGIYIPQSSDANAKGMTKARIIAMAEDVDPKHGFKIGMTVIFNKFVYTEVKLPPLEAGQTERLVLLVNQDKTEACIDEWDEEEKTGLPDNTGSADTQIADAAAQQGASASESSDGG